MITTNLVVALMIVSNGVRQVQAIDVTGIKFMDGYSQTCYFTSDEVKTMYYPSVMTDFVYSTVIRTDSMLWKCARCNQRGRNPFSPDDFLGKDLSEIWFRGMPDKMCRDCISLDSGVTPEHKREHDRLMSIAKNAKTGSGWEAECKYCHRRFYWSKCDCVRVRDEQ